MSRSIVDLVALKVFLKVGTTGNMTAAAQALAMTQSGVSQIIQQLESELGVILLDRTRRPLRLTAAGSILARRAERLVEEADHLPAAVREASLVPEIRVGLVDSFAGTVGPHLIRAFMERVSTITLWAGLTPSLSQALLNRQVDVVVASEAMDDVDSVRRDPLVRESFVIAVPKAYRLGRNELTLEGLAERHPLIRYSARSAIGLQIDRHLRRLGIAAPRRVELDSSDTLFAMVGAGVGWAITTPLCVLHGRPDLDAIRIERLPGPGFTRHLTMIARQGEYHELVDRLANTARTAMRETCVPAIRRSIPWLRDELVVQ
jgi:DNA-binding transcriptional LysR family regulator